MYACNDKCTIPEKYNAFMACSDLPACSLNRFQISKQEPVCKNHAGTLYNAEYTNMHTILYCDRCSYLHTLWQLRQSIILSRACNKL